MGEESKIKKNKIKNKFWYLSTSSMIERYLNWENVVYFLPIRSVTVGNSGISATQYSHLQNGHVLGLCLKEQLMCSGRKKEQSEKICVLILPN